MCWWYLVKSIIYRKWRKPENAPHECAQPFFLVEQMQPSSFCPLIAPLFSLHLPQISAKSINYLLSYALTPYFYGTEGGIIFFGRSSYLLHPASGKNKNKKKKKKKVQTENPLFESSTVLLARYLQLGIKIRSKLFWNTNLSQRRNVYVGQS